MARKKLQHLTDGEIEIMHVLWAAGPRGLPIKTVHATLRKQRKVALTTVASMMQLMEKKKILQTPDRGMRPFLYAPIVTLQEARDRVVEHVTDVLFDGDETKLISFLKARSKR